MRKKTGILLAFIFVVLVIGYNSLFFCRTKSTSFNFTVWRAN